MKPTRWIIAVIKRITMLSQLEEAIEYFAIHFKVVIEGILVPESNAVCWIACRVARQSILSPEIVVTGDDNAEFQFYD